MAHHDAFRDAGGARGVLKEAKGVAVDGRTLPGSVLVRQGLGGEACHRVEARGLGVGGGNHAADGLGHEGDRRLRVLHDGDQPLHVAVIARREGGDGDHARVEAAEEGRNELQARRIQENDPVAEGAMLAKPLGEQSRLAIELRVRQRVLLVLAVAQERVDLEVGMLGGAGVEKVDQG
ncbi:hypothetical protein D3C87_1387390 [compost metagenome]